MPVPAADTLLLTTTRVVTFEQGQARTNATGFFFEGDGGLFLVTSRHVLADPAQNHRPDRLEIEVHTDAANLAAAATISIPLYRDGAPLWREGRDTGGPVDVVAISLPPGTLPAGAVCPPFTPRHLADTHVRIEIGTSLLIVGFPLGFHDALHHMPVARRATVASAHGLRFQGLGYFLTDARTHRGTSGAPVVMRAADGHAPLTWTLLGIHSSRLDSTARDLAADEALGLNSAWYADILLALTQRQSEP